jgi:hypothetical protein
MLRGLLGLILDGALSDGQLYIQTQWRDRISTLPSFTQNLLKKLINERAFDSPLYREIDKVLSSHFTIRCVPRPDIFLDCVKKMNSVIYAEMQGPCEFALSGVLENWSITDRLWKIKGETCDCYHYDCHWEFVIAAQMTITVAHPIILPQCLP